MNIQSTPMDANNALLTEVYLNAKLGADALNTMLSKVGDQAFAQALQQQAAEYKQISDDAMTNLAQRGQAPSRKATVVQAENCAEIHLATLINKTPSHLSQMRMEDDMTGAIQVTRALHRYANAEQPVKDLADRLIQLQEGHIQALKAYL